MHGSAYRIFFCVSIISAMVAISAQAMESQTTIIATIFNTNSDETNSRTMVQLADGAYALSEDVQIIDNNGRTITIEGFVLPHRCRITIQADDEGPEQIVRIRPLHR